MAGVDILNQFPNSRMANAVKLGQSQFRSIDTPATPSGSQNNTAIATATPLTVPAVATYGVVTAIGGPLYYTLDGSTPSASNYSGTLTAGQSVPFSGAALRAMRVFGTTMSVLYLR